MKSLLGWWFGPDDGSLPRWPGETVATGYVYTTDEPTIALCKTGLHGSPTVYDALEYAPGARLSRVRVWGEIDSDREKFCGRNREHIAVIDASALLRIWACWCVRHTTTGRGGTTWDLLTDTRSREAIVIAEQYAHGRASQSDLIVARAAAMHVAVLRPKSAAEAAAVSAVSLEAWQAAWATAERAAWAAALIAGFGNARSRAALVRARRTQSAELERRCLEAIRA